MIRCPECGHGLVFTADPEARVVMMLAALERIWYACDQFETQPIVDALTEVGAVLDAVHGNRTWRHRSAQSPILPP